MVESITEIKPMLDLKKERKRRDFEKMALEFSQATDNVVEKYGLIKYIKGSHTLGGLMEQKIAELMRERCFSLSFKSMIMSVDDIAKLDSIIEMPNCLTRALLSKSGFGNMANGKYNSDDHTLTVVHSSLPFDAICPVYAGINPEFCKIDGFRLKYKP